MQQSQEMSSQEKETLGEVVNDVMGDPETTAESAAEHPNNPEQDELPEYAKKKLGMQEKRHKKELRRMQQQLDEVRSHLGSRPEPQNSPENGMNPYTSQPENGGDINQHIYAAVSKALQAQKDQERQAKDAENMQEVQKHYKSLENHLDNASDSYEDFDDVVKSEDAPYTSAMRDMAMLLHDIPGIDSAKTLYELGKDREKLKQLSSLSPVKQAKEVLKMSIALMGGSGKSGSSSNSKPLGQVKNNPVTSQHINENTPVGDLRKRMKEGGKKWG